MQRVFLFQSLLFFQLAILQAQISRKVLFLGNSYTSTNNLPQIVADAAFSTGDNLIFDSHTPGGYQLLQHSGDALTQSKIMAGGWHYVVLQGQSQEPIAGQYNFYLGVNNLITFVKQHNPCAVPLLYITWGRKNGDALNCPNIPVMCTYTGMDTTIRNEYLSIAANRRTEVSPVSILWRYLRQNHPAIDLYQPDESHPSAEGSYAAACCFYTTIFKKDPTLITFNYSLSPAVAAIIRNAVKTVVFNNLSSWDYKKLPIADFNYQIGSGINQALFTNTSQYADNYLWNYGDLTTSTVAAQPHSYASNGTYTVTLAASNCDLQGLHTSVKDTVIGFCNHTPSISPGNHSLCPGSSVTLWTQAGSAYQWYNNGMPILGATSQSLLVTRSLNPNLIDFPLPSVLTTSAGCAELSQQSQIGENGWQFFGFIISINTIGTVLSGSNACIGTTLSLSVFHPEAHLTQWYKNGVAIPFANSDTLTVTNTGAYSAKIIHPLCPVIEEYSDTLQYNFINCGLSLKEGNIALVDRIYPNPATNNIVVTLKNLFKKEQLQIFNTLGVLMKEVEVSESIEVDISNFPNGLYFIRLNGNHQQALKFVKE